MLPPYSPEPYSDFTNPVDAAKYQAGLDSVSEHLGERALLVIGGEHVDTKASIVSVNPSNPSEVVGTSASASNDHVEQAMAAASDAYEGWSRRTAEERAAVVHRVGDLIIERKFEFTAWQSFEAGKNWAEAEGDVAEAADFCRYYAHQALRMAEPVEVVQVAGETNTSTLQPIGVGVGIPPWNFALACKQP